MKLQAFLLKKRLWHTCSPVNFCEISKNTFFHRTPPVVASYKSFLSIYRIFTRRNFSLVARYSLKFTRCSLLVEKSTWRTHRYFVDFESRILIEISTSNRCHNFQWIRLSKSM